MQKNKQNNDEGMLKGQGANERATKGQSWNNLNNKTVLDYSLKNKYPGVHTDIKKLQNKYINGGKRQIS